MNRTDLRRIEKATESGNLKELRWAENFVDAYIKKINQAHPNKIVKESPNSWINILENIRTAIFALDPASDSKLNALYNEWILSIFNCNQSDGDWRFKIDSEPIKIPNEVIPKFIIRMNNDWINLLEQYSVWQIGKALVTIYDSGHSDCALELSYGLAPLETRLTAILSMKKLYSDCFETHCAPCFGYLSEQGNDLNYICYMLWDITPIGYNNQHQDRDAINEAITEVMKYALTMSNPACIESGLHGLGHMVYKFPKASEIIQSFINPSRKIDPKILRYAEAAKIGNIN